VNCQDVLNKLLALPTGSEGISTITAYRMGKIKRKLIPEIEDYYKAHNALIEKYGKPVNGDPKNFRVEQTSENFEVYNNENNELLKEEIELDIIPLKLDELVKAGLSGWELLLLDFMITE
jgi:hypothetical protein